MPNHLQIIRDKYNDYSVVANDRVIATVTMENQHFSRYEGLRNALLVAIEGVEVPDEL